MVSPRNGLLGLCLLVMALYSAYQQLSIDAALWAVAGLSGAVLGWMCGSGAWRSVGSDLVAALVTVCSVLFGALLPLFSLYQQSAMMMLPAVLGLGVAVWLGMRFAKS